MKGFTTKRAEKQVNVFVYLFEASVGRKTVRGFTLVETLVAIAILTLAVSGSFLVANNAMVAAENVHDQLIASYLAQEGIEYVRMMRDNAYLAAYNGPDASTVAWTNFSASIASCITPNTCTLDPAQPIQNSLAPCAGNNCTPLYLTPSNIYTQQNLTGSVQTSFTRTIQATGVSATDEKIVSRVTWSFHNVLYSVTITDHLTPWQ